jgi:two-component system, chemotaxis family, protein-glutamate methylesterase/glutaminase
VKTHHAIVIGASAGGPSALDEILGALPEGFPLPVIVVMHVHRTSGATWAQSLDARMAITVKMAEDKEVLRPSTVYMAPPDYHLLVERDRSLSLCVDEPVSYSRPSIDVMFSSAAAAYRRGLLAVVLTGANADGAAGVRRVVERGGWVLVQDPAHAVAPTMPQAAIDAAAEGSAAVVVPLSEIASHMIQFAEGRRP